MTGDELKAWRTRERLTLDDAAAVLCIGRRSLIRYEAGQPIPDAVAAIANGSAKPALKPMIAKAVEAVKAVEAGKPRAGSTLKGMPPGTTGYLEADWPFGGIWGCGGLPKGRWRVVLAKPWLQPNGVVITAIEYCSNGVGVPSMIVIGRGDGKTPLLDGMVYGSYHPFRGDPNKPSVPYHVDDLLKGKSKSDARR